MERSGSLPRFEAYGLEGKDGCAEDAISTGWTARWRQGLAGLLRKWLCK